MTPIPQLQSAHAILLLEHKYILQLRDNKPNIAAPGQWSLFGGLLQNGETPLKAIDREIYEELSIRPCRYNFLWHIDYIAEYETELIRSWFFTTNVDSMWSKHTLHEGQATGLFNYKETLNLMMPWVMRKTIERYEKGKYITGKITLDSNRKRD